MTKYSIRITGEFEACHRWKDAPLEVRHLRNVHCHVFHVRVEIAVGHDNRDVEFFMARKDLRKAIELVKRKKDVGSCEMMAESIASILASFKYTINEVIVSEPGIGDGIFRP